MTAAAGAIDLRLTQRAGGLTVGGLFHAAVLAYPREPALQEDGRVLCYAALNERVNRLAHALAARGLQRGDRVAVLSENQGRYIELYLAAARLGVIVACQNWRLTVVELSHCMALAAPSLTLVSERYAATLDGIDAPTGPVIMFGEAYEHALAQASAAEPPDVAEAEDGLAILYTSGTTGLPKGALISQRAMIARAAAMALDTPVERDACFVAWTPLFHMGATDPALATLMRGGKVIVVDGFQAEILADIVGRETIGDFTMIPGVIDRMAAAVRHAGIRPRGIGMMGAMADLVPRHLLAEFTALMNAPYRNTFGSTETGTPPASRGMVPIGVVPERLSKQQSSLCLVRLVDQDDREVPDGEPGELAMRGPTLFSGYWRAPAVTAQDFRGGWFHMGDVFVRNPDRTLDFVDRRKYLIKSGGENIYPAEIERVLLAMPGVADAAVVRFPDPTWGEVPVAFVVAADPGLKEDHVRAACRAAIAGYKQPKRILLVSDADLPRNNSGKIMRHELEARLAAQ